MLNIAVDTGFGRTKALNGQSRIAFPSLVANFRPVRFVSGIETGNNTSASLALEHEGNRYFVGEAAARQGIAQNTIDRERTVAEEGKILTLAALSLLTQQTPAQINLVVGLPVSHYSKLKDRYTGALQKTHRFKQLQVTGETVTEQVINVHGMKVIPQPLGSLFNSLLGEDGEVERAELAEQNIGVIDIGYHTVDLARADCLEFIDRKSASYPLGLYKAAGELAEELNRELDIEAGAEEMEQVLMSGAIKIGGKNIRVDKARENALKQVASEILSRIKSLWPDRWQLDRLLVTGGGGKMLFNHLNRALEDRAELADSPLFANAAGYRKLAKRTWGEN